MFDFGFWELTIVMIVALLVVGPERLPALAGQVGKWVGKAKRILSNIRSDIENEIKAAELKEILEKQQSEIGELKEMLNTTKRDIEEEFERDNDQDDESGDHDLIKAVEEQIESRKQTAAAYKIESKQDESD